MNAKATMYTLATCLVVVSAAVGHALFGDLHLDIAGAVLVGSIPGVLLGARISSRAPGGVVRSALVIVLLASALKLLDVPTTGVGAITGTAVLAAVALALVRRARRAPQSPGSVGAGGEGLKVLADDRKPSYSER